MLRKLSHCGTWPPAQTFLCKMASPFDNRLDATVTNPGSALVGSLEPLPARGLQKVAAGFPGSLALVAVKNLPGSEYSVTIVPSQADDLGGDGMGDEFEFPIWLKPDESKQVEIYFSMTLRNKIVYPRSVHASHSYGCNRQTSAAEGVTVHLPAGGQGK